MRLIDADKFRTDWLHNGLNEKVYDTNDFLDSIDNAPTIDAAQMQMLPKEIRFTDGANWSQFDDCRKVISVLQNEIQCVKDAEFCDRQCAKCKLVMEADDIIAALECAIKAVELCGAKMDARGETP